MSRAVRAVELLLLALVVCAWTGTPIPGSTPATNFALHDQDGRVVSLSSERGRYVVLMFLYTHCTDVCPLIAANVGVAMRALGPENAGRIGALAVSVDPAGDTRAAVRGFLRAHRDPSSFQYLVGTRAELQTVWQEFNVLVEPRSEIRVSHDAPVFVLDPRGRPILLYGENVGAAALAHDLRRLLAR